MHVLIVDDHPANLTLLRRQLETEGHTVLEAANGVEALRALDRAPVDAVISDILMPVMDGFRLCREIRKSAKLKALPLILHTSTYNSAEDRELAQAVGADSYVVKPSPPQVLLEALREAVQSARHSKRAVVPEHDDTYVLEHYNEALVHKLEEKNIELQEALQKLQAANAEILELNRDLEARVDRRPAELQAANRDLEAFSYSVSHDLRAPLRAINGFIGMLARDYGTQLPAEAQAMMGRISANAGNMAALIADLLEFARFGRMHASMQQVDLAHLARECIEDLAAEQQGRKVEIVMGGMPMCRGDPILLKQALLNLIGNALKYTRKRAAARIEIGAEVRGQEYVGYVRDNGAGFDMRHAHKLFEVFERLHTRTEFEGTGLGLAIVKRAFEKHGGLVLLVRCTRQCLFIF